jgi:serine/threonine protein kinase
MINQQIQNYKIISLLGEGGMGDVFLAEHVSIKRKVAIKVLKPELVKNEEIRKRFKNEASMLAHLQHSNIVGLIDYVEQENGLFLIMEYVEGQDLYELVKAQQVPITIERAKKLMTQILEAFKYAHQNGIIHRDVKPSNVLITADDQIKVLDFGIAKLVGDNQHHLTKTGTRIGTVYYMSPEQVKCKELDQRSDIYSLGVTFYELLSGVCPYRGMNTEYEIYDSIVKDSLLPLTTTMGEIYSKVWSVIEKATEKETSHRFQNCEEFILGLNKDNEVSPKKTQDPIQEKSNLTKNRIIWIALTLVFVVVIFLLYNNRAPEIRDLPINPEPKTPEIIVETTNDEPLNIRVKACSELPPSYGFSYSAYNTIDKDISTWWSPMKSLGNEVSIGFTFNQFKTMKGISIHGGSHFPNFQNLGDLYWLNLRIRRARVVFSNGHEEIITLKDLDYQQNVYFNNPIKCNFFMLELLDYYPSIKWKDYCISELEPIF